MLGLFICVCPHETRTDDGFVDIPRDISGWRQGFVTHSADETERAGETLAKLIPADTTLLLYGELGAGKTTFVRGFARGLGITGDITSPSFALLNVHRGQRQLLHVDAYRLTAPAQLEGLLLNELAETPFNLVIEWPERIGDRKPPSAWSLRLSAEGMSDRRLVLADAET